MPTTLPETLQLFEASWEICNKAGGIHTVLTSKLPYAQEHFAGHYLPVGPYLGSQQENSFREHPLPSEFKKLAAALEQKGVSLHYGSWLIENEPPVLLLGWEGLLGKLNSYKTRFWEKYQLDTLGTSFYDVDQPLLWSIAVGELVTSYAELNQHPIILHAHEWLSAGAFLVIGEQNLPHLHSIFTTHATVLGRALSSHDTFIYDKFATLDPSVEAKRWGVVTKHQLEKLAANLATIFTTVSQITAEEATAFLGRKPEVVVENGLNAQYFPAFDLLCERHLQVREQLHDFVSAYFFPSYRFNLAETQYQFTMGRYELHNKGYDLYLRSLGKLNEELKASKSQKTVISFFLVPGDALRLRPEVSLQLSIYRQVCHILTQYVKLQQRDLFESLWHHAAIDELELLPKSVRNDLHLLLSRMPSGVRPAISPFDLREGDNDALIQTAHQYGLRNEESDRVKILFFPIYFDGFDGVFNLPLYDIISGCHLGVFPSFYEPWGYTPMESLAMSVPAVTSTLAGFGRAAATKKSALPSGVFVVDRNKDDEEAEAAQLSSILRIGLDEDERAWLLRRMAAYLTVQDFDWSILYKNYLDAYELATNHT